MTRLDKALRSQLVYAALVCAWQVTGVVATAAGRQAPGPGTAWTTAVLAVAIGAALVCARRRALVLYAVLSAFVGVVAVFAIRKAFVLDPALWPSDALRYAGAAINVFGVGAALAAVAAVFAQSRRTDDARPAE